MGPTGLRSLPSCVREVSRAPRIRHRAASQPLRAPSGRSPSASETRGAHTVTVRGHADSGSQTASRLKQTALLDCLPPDAEARIQVGSTRARPSASAGALSPAPQAPRAVGRAEGFSAATLGNLREMSGELGGNVWGKCPNPADRPGVDGAGSRGLLC